MNERTLLDYYARKVITPLCLPMKDIRNLIIEISLNDASVRVRRKLSVPSSLLVGHLSNILMYAMGWNGGHLKEIEKDGILYKSPFERRRDSEYVEPGQTVRNSFKWTAGQLLKKPGDSFSFIYDLGDNWKHTVTLLEVRKYEDYELSSGPGADIIDGEGCCPPDDVGGVFGYAELIRVMHDPGNPEFEHYHRWAGEAFDPQWFDIKVYQYRVWDYQRTIEEARLGFYYNI